MQYPMRKVLVKTSFLRHWKHSINPKHRDSFTFHLSEPGHLPLGKLMNSHIEFLYHFIIIQYLAEIIGGEMCPMDDALEAKWVTLDQLPEFEITGSLKNFLVDIGLYPS